MLSLKEGVSVQGIQPELVLGLVIVSSIWEYYTHGIPFVITSVSDGVHSANSLHYSGRAVDIRSRDLSVPQLNSMIALFRRALGPDYDVVLEPDHIHLEFDPKTIKH